MEEVKVITTPERKEFISTNNTIEKKIAMNMVRESWWSGSSSIFPVYYYNIANIILNVTTKLGGVELNSCIKLFMPSAHYAPPWIPVSSAKVFVSSLHLYPFQRNVTQKLKPIHKKDCFCLRIEIWLDSLNITAYDTLHYYAFFLSCAFTFLWKYSEFEYFSFSSLVLWYFLLNCIA